jgi:hypothetical protein
MPDEALDQDTWYVDSRGVGSGMQPRPCGDDRRGAVPAPADDPVAVAFSGNGRSHPI